MTTTCTNLMTGTKPNAKTIALGCVFVTGLGGMVIAYRHPNETGLRT